MVTESQQFNAVLKKIPSTLSPVKSTNDNVLKWSRLLLMMIYNSWSFHFPQLAMAKASEAAIDCMVSFLYQSSFPIFNGYVNIFLKLPCGVSVLDILTV